MNRTGRESKSALLAVAALAAAALVACGGGGGNPASAGTASTFALGHISGFGSIVVNGVHYDESTAAVEDEDGQAGSAADLKLGSVVAIDAGDIDRSGTQPSAKADHVKLIGLMKGPIESVGTDSFVVLGQTVKVTTATVFDDSLSGRLAALQIGSVVKVYGTLDAATGIYTATRVEPKAGAAFYGLRGVVAAVDVTAKTLTIGTMVIDVSAAPLPAGLAVGNLVRLKLQTTRPAGEWVAVSVESAKVGAPDDQHAEVEGTVTDFTSATSFGVDGLPVDATGAQFPDGTAGIVSGARVEVEGSIINGTLVATKVEVKSNDGDAAAGFEVDGSISAADPANSTITVRGVTVKYGANTTISNGTAADLTIGVGVEVHGTLGTDGVTLQADSIAIERKS
ncbi:MAG TPA: DUF5666 domain-containing protein [Steroidobacteraceae bacterium]